ncbi:hypothetical protein JTE90_018159 [Oedothorax gibbosus]|uniref:Uncharacterized protein n=1 Tax=Oedothorax gibbosus TaxID=931172 RepID=A0AAV6U8N9_9ARAC|nr:hypothetical protein JTE90_018159 [Oedothorax gibbosus]
MLLGEKIVKSKLAPWQRIDALKTFFFPAFVFHMRTEQLTKGDMKVIDDFIRPLIKDTLYLNESAANEYLYGSSKSGLLGIPKLAEEVDVMMVDNAFKLLTSKDQRIQELAWGDLLLHARKRTGLDPSPSLIESFLNGVQDEEGFRHTSCPYSSNWSHARSATSRLGIKWRCRELFDIELHIDDKVLTQNDRTKICRTIKESLRACWTQELIAKPSQGVAIEVSSLHRASSHFLRSGNYTKFADWRFIHKARLNLLRLNGNTPWDKSLSQCRRCPASVESTLHVLSLCKPNMGRRTLRHNAIVDRIHNAGTGSLDSDVPHDNSDTESDYVPCSNSDDSDTEKKLNNPLQTGLKEIRKKTKFPQLSVKRVNNLTEIPVEDDSDVNYDNDIDSFAPCNMNNSGIANTFSNSSRNLTKIMPASTNLIAETIGNTQVFRSNNKNNIRKWDKRQSCLYCGSLELKLPRHLERRRKDETEIQKFLSMEKGCKERSALLKKLRNAVEKYQPCDMCNALFKKGLEK